jgi:D-alanyl-D-alanine carboxypeptidase
VTWEPWHWRWVGTSPTAPGAAAARALFETARTRFPAQPGILDIVLPPEWQKAIAPTPSASPTPVWPK